MCVRLCVYDVSTVCVEPPFHKVGLNIMRVSDRETLFSLFQGLVLCHLYALVYVMGARPSMFQGLIYSLYFHSAYHCLLYLKGLEICRLYAL